MEDNLKPLECNDDDVLSFGNTTYKAGVFKRALNNSFNQGVSSSIHSELRSQRVSLPPSFHKQQWLDEGIDCEILNLGSNKWKKGKIKVKFSVEFYVEPEEEQKISDPDSLDDLRRELNQDNS